MVGFRKGGRGCFRVPRPYTYFGYLRLPSESQGLIEEFRNKEYVIIDTGMMDRYALGLYHDYFPKTFILRKRRKFTIVSNINL